MDENPDHARNIVGMEAPAQKAFKRLTAIWLRLLHGAARVQVAQGRRQGVEKFAVMSLISHVGITVEVINGVLLSLGPEAFAINISAHDRKRMQARGRDQQ